MWRGTDRKSDDAVEEGGDGGSIPKMMSEDGCSLLRCESVAKSRMSRRSHLMRRASKRARSFSFDLIYGPPPPLPWLSRGCRL